MQLTIKQKLFLFTGVAILSVGGIGFAAWYNSQAIQDDMNKVIMAQKVEDLNNRMRVNRLQLLLSRYEAIYIDSIGQEDATVLEKADASEAALLNDIQELIDLNALFLEQQELLEIQKAAQKVASAKIISLLGNPANALRLQRNVAEANINRKILLEKLVQTDAKIEAYVTEIREHQRALIHQSKIITYIVVSISFILLAVIAFWIVRSINHALAGTGDTIRRLAQREYNIAIPGIDRQDEFGDIARELDNVKETIADYSGQMNAIHKSQAVIEFDLKGNILNANDNFLNALGYSLGEIQGKHHAIFVSPKETGTPEYKAFWEKLGRGEFDTGEYRRIDKKGNDIWIQASYNPIYNPAGDPVKVVKFASDITDVVSSRLENERGMQEAVTVLRAVTQGDLENRMNGEYAGPFKDIKAALNATIDKL
ncbi:MAG: hypothetical protein CMM93_01070, partial [Rickettsiales bacterium]|nr:hypothetical protein [Rickettsiales bacterium]